MPSKGFTTCLWFDGKAEQAAEFYLSVFKDGSMGRVLRYGDAGPGEPGSVVTVEFTVNGQTFVGLNGGPDFTFSEAISFQITCADQEEVDHYWSRLTENGGEGSACGWLKDQFGVSWQVLPEGLLDLIGDTSDPEAASRATKAMFTMGKIDLAAVRAAHAGTA